MKPFDLEAAKKGAPVCTSKGEKARILCFDLADKNDYHIAAAIANEEGNEFILGFNMDGRNQNIRLCMDPVVHKGWVNLYRLSKNGTIVTGRNLYPSKDEALQGRYSTRLEYIGTTEIEFEEE